MTYSGEQFREVAKPVGDFMRELIFGYYWCYNYQLGQTIDAQESPASATAINDEKGTIWDLKLTEVTSRSAVPEQRTRVRNLILYSSVANAKRYKGRYMTRLRGWSEHEEEECAETSFRILSNAWRDEYAVVEPIDSPLTGAQKRHSESVFDEDNFDVVEDDPISQRMRTAEWRIIKTYYALYKSAEAIVRSQEYDDVDASHTSVLARHQGDYLQSKCRDLYPFPLRPLPEQTDSDIKVTQPFPIPDAQRRRVLGILQTKWEEHLERMAEQIKEIDTDPLDIRDGPEYPSCFYSMMKILREWASYHHGGIFARLYGEDYIRFIDAALSLTTFAALTAAEVFLIVTFGYDRFKQAYEQYRASCEVGIKPSGLPVNSRDIVYRQALSGF